MQVARRAGLWRGTRVGYEGRHVLLLRACMRPERAGFWCMLGGPGSRRQHHLRGRTRRRSSRSSSTAGPLHRRRRPAMVGGRVSAGSKRVRRHNRERGPCLLTASPSDGPGVRRFWPPAIELRKRGKSLLVFSQDAGTQGSYPPLTSKNHYLVVSSKITNNLIVLAAWLTGS